MSAVFILTLCITLLWFVGYQRWSRHIVDQVFHVKPTEVTPAHNPALQDGTDYIPTKKPMLWGHHYTSIAGAAPIIGPAVAVFWGWLPALLWIVFGTIFMGAVHDVGALIVSMRHEGRSIADISGLLIHPRVRILFQVVILCLIWVVLAVFGIAIGVLFEHHPATVLPINVQIIAAIAIGLLVHHRNIALLWPTLMTLILLYGAVPLGVHCPIHLPELALPAIGVLPAFSGWAVILILYSGLASAWPVWLLLQPRDYLNAYQLVIGLGLLIIGLIALSPPMQAPPIAWAHIRSVFSTAPHGENIPPVLPMLFVTVACGAISGFHGLVASGTTSKQLDKASDVRDIGYGSMLGEALLAVLATLAVSAGLNNWGSHYHQWNGSGLLAIDNVVQGAGQFIHALGIPTHWAEILVAMLVIAFAATSMDTAARIQRYIIQECGESLNLLALKNKWVATAIAVLPAIPLVLAGKGAWGPLWLLFGVTNQLIGGLTFLVLSVYLVQKKRPVWPVMLPMVVVLGMTTTALIYSLNQWVHHLGEQGVIANELTIALGVLILILEGWFITEVIVVWRKQAST